VYADAPIHIRLARPDDAEEIAREYAGLHHDQWDASGDVPRTEDAEPDWLAEVLTALDDPDVKVFVAEADGGLVGTARVELAERPYYRIADLRRLYVKPEWRQRGVATALVHAAEEAAHDESARELRLTVVAENATALLLYEHLGYDRFAIRLRRALRPEG
jgi:GNAT superfamily N-acetyltransferase